MTEILVENIAKEKTDVKDQILGVNVIEVTIDDKKIEFPNIAVINSELQKAEDLKTSLDTNLIQLYHQVQRKSPLTRKETKNNIISKYTNLKNKYPNSILDIGYDFIKDYKKREAERQAILEIQKTLKTLFLSDIEVNMEQSVEAFASQLENLENPHNQIICPTIDLEIVTPGLFAAKVDYILEKKYPRFNVKFAPFDANYINWLRLSQRIFGKNVWCNMTSVTKGYFHTTPPQRSLLACTFLYGIHTASHDYMRFIKKKDDKPYEKPKENTGRVLDRNSLCYNKMEISPEEAVVESMNNLSKEIEKIKEHVRKETFFSEYVPKSKALSGELDDLKRRM